MPFRRSPPGWEAAPSSYRRGRRRRVGLLRDAGHHRPAASDSDRCRPPPTVIPRRALDTSCRVLLGCLAPRTIPTAARGGVTLPIGTYWSGTSTEPLIAQGTLQTAAGTGTAQRWDVLLTERHTMWGIRCWNAAQGKRPTPTRSCPADIDPKATGGADPIKRDQPVNTKSATLIRRHDRSATRRFS